MNARNIRVSLTINAGQYKRLVKNSRRMARFTKDKQPGAYLLSDYLQPGSRLIIEEALTQMEKDLEEMETLTFDPFEYEQGSKEA